ncbi:hypothetical protein [Pelovirga terrestris]|uniref:Uncharacterized protein n=1 Tax=Pelovirga terrestris TaxID=2771352 RepID=A0A8J6ULV4_9BACT|nr:hypothetical protein [Pelovirga terrestris]MBD1401882.1 hypothetical protein [Pelovirga terrestris]
MERIQTQQQIKDLDLPVPFLEALLYFLSAEMRISAPKPYEPEDTAMIV